MSHSDSMAEPRVATASPVAVEVFAELLAGRADAAGRPVEALLDLGLVPERDFALALAVRTGLPFVGLRAFLPDPAHFLYVPLALALVQLVCPLAIGSSRLRLATAFPDPDVSFVRARFPSLELELAIAPRSEIVSALRAVTPL